MINSKAKGNSAERVVCKLFRDALGGKWERRSMGIPGCDIVAPESFQYALEVKHDKTLRCYHFWYPTDKLVSFWDQAKAQTPLGKRPLLVMKVEGKWFVIWQAGPTVGPIPAQWMNTKIGDDWVAITLLDSFLKETLRNTEIAA